MKKCNIFAVFILLLAAVFLAGSENCPQAAALVYPDIRSDAALLVETTSGQILFEKNKDEKQSVKDITPILTVLIVSEEVEQGKLQLSDTVVASRTALDSTSSQIRKFGLTAGEEMTLKDLLYIAGLTSAGDACSVLAEEVSGTVALFTERMNEKAATLGCTMTHFNSDVTNNDVTQETTAGDMYLIFKAAMQDSLFAKIGATADYSTEATNYSASRIVKNSNRQMNVNSVYYNKLNKAEKSIARNDGGYGVLACAADKDMALITVVVNGTKTTTATEAETLCYNDTRTLCGWGFSGYAYQQLINKDEVVATVPVEMSRGISSVNIVPEQAVSVLLPIDMSVEKLEKNILIYHEAQGKPLTAPVNERDILGELTVKADGVIRKKIKLVAARYVPLDSSRFIKQELTATLKNPVVQFIGFLLLVLFGAYIVLIVRDKKRRAVKQHMLAEKRKELIEERHHITK